MPAGGGRLVTLAQPAPGGDLPAGTFQALWAAVLIKDFGSAKQRLSPALDPRSRRRLAEENARLALAAAGALPRLLAVCGSAESARLARTSGAQVVLEDEPRGQNAAAQRAIEYCRDRGADAILLISSDLPLVRGEDLRRLVSAASPLPRPLAVAVPAAGRGGTNALLLAPADCLELRFGDDSLAKFEREARERRVGFHLFESPRLALDLDEPADLEALAAR